MGSNSAKRRVLIVDDDPDITLTLSRGLQNHGFSIEAYNNPVLALSEFKPHYYDMIILDVRMSEMSGFEFARNIWAKDPDARICFFSAFDIYEQEARVKFEGMKIVNFLKKPITPNELANYITNLLQN